MAETTIRLAGNNEKRCIVREDLGLYGSVAIIGLYRIEGQLSSEDIEDKLRTALTTCQQQHPVLGGVAFRKTDTEAPELVKRDNVQPLISVESSEDRPEEDFIAACTSHSCIQNEDVLPWRINVLHYPSKTSANSTEFLVSFVASHGLADGRSGYIFHSSLLQALNGISPGSVDKVIPPALENIGTLSISTSFLLGPLINEFLPGFIGRLLGYGADPAKANAWRGVSSRPRFNGSPRTAVHLFSLDSSQTKAVLATCRRHKSRLTGLLNHLVARSLSIALRRRGQHCSHFVSSTALDLRSALPQDELDTSNAIGVHVSLADEVIDVPIDTTSAKLDWIAVRTTTEKLAKASRTLQDQPVGLLKYLSNYREWTTKKSEKRAEASFGMSNLGVFDASTSGNVKMERVVFAQSGDATGEVINVNVASTQGGSLSIAFTWWPGMLGVEDEKAFISETSDCLLSLLKTVGEQAR